jgi:GNAT superfamily N-acetyltransferase
MIESVREATDLDVAAISHLVGELGYPATEAQMRERLAAARESPDCAVYVAESGGRIAGWIEVAEHHNLASGWYVEIMGLVVSEDQRGAGVGRALVQRARRWAKDGGHGRLRVRTNQLRTPAHTFYERLGFTLTKSQRVYDGAV